MAKNKLRIRRSILEIQKDYENGKPEELENLMRAWKGIKELPPEHEHSFLKIGGFHGEPFRGAGWGNSSYWGGYCNHGNVLFPTWHRVYILKIEEALRSIPGCEEVTLPYWDETDKYSLKHGIPSCLTAAEFTFSDGTTIPNPLKSFIFPINVNDNVSTDKGLYTKPKGYETVRYPYSGLVGTKEARKATKKHNAQYTYEESVTLLNENVVNWLTTKMVLNGKSLDTSSIAKAYKDCLDAPNYTIFSNTTSMTEWNGKLEKGESPVVALESPHNSVHLSVGGFDIPHQKDYSPIPGANGDMGENNTAGLDPIFFFHHCNVDRVFWLWQQKHDRTDHLEIIPEYPGTNSVDNQGPTPGVAPNSWLTLESPLMPFMIKENGEERPYTSLDCINTEKQLGVTYSTGSLDELKKKKTKRSKKRSNRKIIKVSGINKAPIKGSFLINAYAKVGDEKYHIGSHAVLSRWNSISCANCQTHLEVQAFFELPEELGVHKKGNKALKDSVIEIEINDRDHLVSGKKRKSTSKSKINFEVDIL